MVLKSEPMVFLIGSCLSLLRLHAVAEFCHFLHDELGIKNECSWEESGTEVLALKPCIVHIETSAQSLLHIV